MSEKINEELLDILKKSLPGLQVEAITEMYEENGTLKIEIGKLKETNKSRGKMLDDLQIQVTRLIETNDALKRCAEKNHEIDSKLKEREEAVYKKELALENELLKCNLTAEQHKVELAKEFFKIPFQNRVLRENILEDKVLTDSHNIPLMEYDSSGNSVTRYSPAQTTQRTEPTTKTTNTEEG